jgi:hypothetical protein
VPDTVSRRVLFLFPFLPSFLGDHRSRADGFSRSSSVLRASTYKRKFPARARDQRPETQHEERSRGGGEGRGG